jgi:hypothetical protein
MMFFCPLPVTILYFVRAAAAFKQYAHGLWPSPRWLGHARQMGTAAGLGRKSAEEEPKNDAFGATRNHRHHDSCQSTRRRRHCVSNSIGTSGEEVISDR